MAFTGFPEVALDFYGRLKVDNTKPFWDANKHTYQESVREPMQELTEALAEEFGQPRLFRPHRDTRFSKDKTPYKDHQAALVSVGEGMGFFVGISADGLRTGGGSMHLAPDQLARFREAVDAPAGADLDKAVASLRRKGFGIGGNVMKSRPRGVARDHPRVELLRHRSLIAWHEHGAPAWLATGAAVRHVRDDWRLVRPMVAWLDEHVGPTQEPPRRRR